MYLTLFVLLMVLSFILIALGFLVREHAELSLIGFTFLFLLSILIMANDIQIKTGEDFQETYIYGINLTTDSYHTDYTTDFNRGIADPADALIFHTNHTIRYTYEDIDLGGNYSRTFGYWLALISMIGFVGVLISLKPKEDM